MGNILENLSLGLGRTDIFETSSTWSLSSGGLAMQRSSCWDDAYGEVRVKTVVSAGIESAVLGIAEKNGEGLRGVCVGA